MTVHHDTRPKIDGDGEVNLQLYRYLDLVGDGTGTDDFTANYSGLGNDLAFLIPPAGTIYKIERMIVYIEDGAGFRAERYASLGAALTNGLSLVLKTAAGVITSFMDGVPIKRNAQWGATCYDVELKSWGPGNEVLLVRWTFAKTGAPIRIDGSAGEFLEMPLLDDLSGLVHHQFMFQGTIENTAT